MELVAQDIGYSYGAVEALAGVSLSVSAGTVHAVVGPSGSGKSTLLHILAGLMPPGRGQVELRAGSSRRKVAGPLPGLGMAFGPTGLWEHLTVQEHLTLVSKARRGHSRERIEQILERVSLAGLRARKPGQLSSGQRQRLSLARAIIARPRWLLLDEPLNHLDGAAQLELLDLLRETWRQTGAAVVFTTHQPAEVLAWAHAVTVLVDGRTQQQGTVAQVYAQTANPPAALALGPASARG